MLITRGRKPHRDFAIISNSLLRDENLSFRARGILCCILSHEEGYQISSDRLAGKEGREAIRTGLRELATAGYLKRTKSQNEKGLWTSSAIVSDLPEFLPELPSNNEPTPRNPSSVQPTPRNPSSVNRASVFRALKENNKENYEKEKEKVAQKETLKKISFEEGTFININDAQVATWTAAYPAANVPAEILRAAAWLDANPSKKKSDCKRFLNGWLSRAQDNAPRAAVGEQAKPKNTSAPAFALPEWINQAHWDAWHSTAQRKNASNEQKQMAVDKLAAWKAEGIDHALALENAAIGGWKGLFKPDAKTASHTPMGHHSNRHAGAAVAIWGNPEPTNSWEYIDV